MLRREFKGTWLFKEGERNWDILCTELQQNPQNTQRTPQLTQ